MPFPLRLYLSILQLCARCCIARMCVLCCCTHFREEATKVSIEMCNGIEAKMLYTVILSINSIYVKIK